MHPAVITVLVVQDHATVVRVVVPDVLQGVLDVVPDVLQGVLDPVRGHVQVRAPVVVPVVASRPVLTHVMLITVCQPVLQLVLEDAIAIVLVHAHHVPTDAIVIVPLLVPITAPVVARASAQVVRTHVQVVAGQDAKVAREPVRINAVDVVEIAVQVVYPAAILLALIHAMITVHLLVAAV